MSEEKEKEVCDGFLLLSKEVNFTEIPEDY